MSPGMRLTDLTSLLHSIFPSFGHHPKRLLPSVSSFTVLKGELYPVAELKYWEQEQIKNTLMEMKINKEQDEFGECLLPFSSEYLSLT
jgi:hypothetical protein